MSERKSRADANMDRRSIAAVASSSVEGYLKNASRRVRVPTAEGGRGTRRKLAMVTSAVDKVQQTGIEEVNVDDEWDEVDLPSVPIALPVVKKQEDVKGESSIVKADAESGDIPGTLPEVKLVKDETTALQNTDSPDAAARVDDNGTNNPPDAFVPGTRPPLMEQPAQSSRPGAWRQRDPAYEAMVEQRDLLAAQRRSERIQRTSETAAWLLSLFIRGRLLWRQAHHPRFIRSFLSLRRPGLTAPPTRKRKSEATNTLGEQFVFYDAVLSAQQLAAAAARPSARKLSLAPAWVTLASDAVHNKTSEAVRLLLTALNDVFCLPTSTVSDGAEEDDDTSLDQEFTDWTVPLQRHVLQDALRQYSESGQCVDATNGMRSPAVLPHPLYFSLAFLTLAHACKLRCRLVVAKQHVKTSDGRTADGDDGDAEPRQSEGAKPTTKLSIFSGMSKPPKRGRPSGNKKQNEEAPETKSKRLPTSCFWVEVWSAERQSFISVNPCGGCATLWGAPYTFSIGPDVLVDVTARYTSKMSSCYHFGRRLGSVQQYSFLWRDKLSWDDNREVTDILLESFQNKRLDSLTAEQRRREDKQLESLRYSESVPTTLTALHRHPLFVIESDLARHEGIYPKNSTTAIGSVKGNMVYKRSAVAILRSRDGWLREGRSLMSEETVPYKTVPPPASRPFASPSHFYHISQTKMFEPLPLREDGSIPLHGKTSWYVVLDATPPPGLTHLTQPQIARVARRMQLSFGLAVTGFNRRKVEANRRGHWEVVIDGIVVRDKDKASLCRAYEEWIQLVQEQEAARRRDRAFHWWLLFSQRLLTVNRLREQYMSGVAHHGELPRM